MKAELQKMPAPLQRQILLRAVFGIAFLLIFVVLLFMRVDIYTLVPSPSLAVFCFVSAFLLFRRASKNEYVIVQGTVTDASYTLFKRRVKTLFMQAERYSLQVELKRRPRRIAVGATVYLYLANNTPVFERNGNQVIHSYLALEVKGEASEYDESRNIVE